MDLVKKRFFESCKKNYSKSNVAKFRRASRLAEASFFNIRRLSGENRMNHNYEMGFIMVENMFSYEAVLAGLLYGTEKEVLPSEIEKLFGREVSDLVYGQLQLKEIKSKHKDIESEILRKILLITLGDPQIIFVKLVDKLINLETLDVFSIIKKRKIAKEVLSIYAPLANRLGLEAIKRQLEDKALRVLNKKKYDEIVNFLRQSKEQREDFMKRFIEMVTQDLGGINILKIKGRNKHIYSIYKKITERKVPLDLQRDHVAIRVITNSSKNCYTILGILHEKYESIPGTLKDYILSPKTNGYRSIHTILRIDGKFVEVQIRTKQMDELAEEGVASHWSYKKMKSDVKFEKRVSWLKEILQLKGANSGLLNSIKHNIFGDKIYCYTPKGDSIELPKGSTILDFAYSVHQEVGSTAVGGRINGVFASLKKELESGDVVSIVTNKLQIPRRDWMKFVVSTRAKNFIRKAIKKREHIIININSLMKKEKNNAYDSLVYCEEFSSHECIFAKCCNPVPLKEIVGIIKSHKKIAVHDSKCLKISNLKDKQIPLIWREEFDRPIKILVKAKERSGVLADFLNTIVQKGFVIEQADIKILDNELIECSFIIIPRKISEVVKLISSVKKVRGFFGIRFE